MTDQYVINTHNRLEYLQMIEGVIPGNLSKRNYSLVVENYSSVASTYVDLGLLHWRHGLDPRPDFEKVVAAYEKMSALARQHSLPKNVASIPEVYAALAIMGKKTSIEFEDEAYHAEHRWPCYEYGLVYKLHQQPLSAYHKGLLDRYLSENDKLQDQSFRTYFRLIGMLPADDTQADLVKMAEANWIRRKRDRSFGDGWAWFGHGVMNDIYVDIYLAAVLHKIGWQGESIHCWKW